MKNKFATQNIVVAGLGVTGQACVRFLQNQGAKVTVWDTRAQLAVPESITVPVVLGEPPVNFWQQVNLLILSPGISPAIEAVSNARAAGVEVIGDIEFFARLTNIPAFGITGSNGKTTVTLLLTHILKNAGMKVCAAGNVGMPVLEILAMNLDAVVLELSSFQLESTSTLQLKAATILNVSDDHLDRHGSLQSYTETKQRIYAHCEHAVSWRAQPETAPVATMAHTTFGLDESDSNFGLRNNWITWQGKPVVDMAKAQLVGRHNALNIQAALALAMQAGVQPDTAAPAVYSFVSAPHRCVQIASHRRIRWIDDSKATNIGATLAAIEGLGATRTGKLILIAGGDAKGADLTALQPALNQYVDWIITLGRDGKKIAALTEQSEYVNDMRDAVTSANRRAQAGDIVLLSPACASLDMFDNYAHRAKVFVDAVNEVAAQ
ncbi:UDP-N-acetylmuramoyl-L-alanine--D-glutamate ligase [Alteromonas pelagimontana]|uniref:UDP-N-acetylmuramoylalanine--D-glutamate ligase n=2 Tax=Alteromonas pelagimontana TaxID=1858656 RepID=A0A6M4MIH6_9ALTE|nr:UDP-N-acetylmuramoyl-L-alanine--D-glutamate ligase [Alteromonas pelagimontana]